MDKLAEFPLSVAQRGVLLGHLLDPSGFAYNIGQYEAIDGPLDIARFVEAARYVVAHTDALRTRIVSADSDYAQRIEIHNDFCLPVIDLSGTVDPEAESQIRLQQLVSAPFDLLQGPLFRWTLVRVSKARWYSIGIVHHVAFDGLSGLLWARRTAEVYTALVTGDPLPVYETGEVATLLEQEAGYLASSAMERDRQYWQQRLVGCEPSAAWSGRRPGKSRNSFRETVVLPEALTAQLRTQVQRLDTTVGQLVTAASALLQCQHGRSNSCVLGLPVLGRRGRAARLIPGMTSNVVPLRLDLGLELTVAELVSAVGQQFAAALRHQRYDSVQLWRDLGLKPEDSDLYSLSVNLMPFDHGLRFADSPSQNHNLSNGPELGLGLMVYDEPKHPQLRLDLNGNTDLYAQEDLARYLTQLLQLLEQIGLAPGDAPLARLHLLSPRETEQHAAFNATNHSIDTAQLLPDLFAAQVIKTPAAIAVVFEDTTFTYAELDARSNQLARYLISLGAGPEVRVAIGLERSLDLVISILATLKSGAAYVPLDPEYPVDRLSFMLSDSAASLVLTTRDLAERLSSGGSTHRLQQVLLNAPAVIEAFGLLSVAPLADADRHSPLQSQNLAYLIYTSGSTGRPKAVGNTHSGAVNSLAWSKSTYSLSAEDRVLHKTAVTFDVAVLEVLLPLLHGAQLILARPGGQGDPEYLMELVLRRGITILQFVPAMLGAFLNTARQAKQVFPVRHIVTGGEVLERGSQTDCHRLFGDVLWNNYGPTEAAIDVTCWRSTVLPEGAPIPIGSPIWNTQIHVLDAALRPVPIGVWGELYIAGAGLARGYVNRPGLTAERFIASPFSHDGARMYRSGDLARWTDAGVLEFGGRADEQVKIRGFRIEPGEIASALSAIEGISQAAVVVREVAGERRLIAYLSPQRSGSIPDASVLRQRLSQSLPDYMIPAAFMQLDALPLTSSGKLDRRALPDPEIAGDSAYVPPETASEILLCRLFAELTGATQVSVEDNFFALGGDSITAIRLVSRARREGCDFSVEDVFAYRTPRGLAEIVDVAVQDQAGAVVPGSGQHADGSLVLSYGQERLWTLDQLEGGRSAQYNIPLGLWLEGPVVADALESSLRGLMERHAPLRTVIKAPQGLPAGQLLPMASICPVLERIDVSGSPDPQAEAIALMSALAAEPFDLAQAPCLKARLIRVSSSRQALVLVVHHGACDGSSLPVLLSELAQGYNAALKGYPSTLGPLAYQYADYAAWHRSGLQQSGDLDRQLEYWKTQLKEAPPLLSLPLDQPRTSDRVRRAGYVDVSLSAATATALQGLAQRHSATLFSVLLAGFSSLLSRLARQETVVIGTPVEGRLAAASHSLVGFFVNTLALRLELGGEPTLSELLTRTHATVLAALEHQAAPFEQVVEAVNPERSLAHAPVFQAMFSWQSGQGAGLALEGLNLTPHLLGLAQTKFDFTLSLGQTPDGEVHGAIEYDADLFSEQTARRWAGMLKSLYEQMAQGLRAQEPLALLGLSPPAELEALAGFNTTDHALDSALLLPDLFAAQVQKSPDAIALVFEDSTLTYAELDARSSQLARYLISLGAGPEVRVAIGLERSLDLIIAILATMKSGAAYVPLDPEYPVDRLRYLLSDSAASLVITMRQLSERLSESLSDHGSQHVLLDDSAVVDGLILRSAAPITDVDRHARLRPQNPAYLIYTSGSTGLPKGVSGTGEALRNRLLWAADVFPIDPAHLVVCRSSIAFIDGSTEVLGGLMQGRQVLMLPACDGRDAHILLELLLRTSGSRLNLVPGLLSSLIEVARVRFGEAWSTGIRGTWVSSGEWLHESLAAQARCAFPAVRLLNFYGMTEAAGDSVAARAEGADAVLGTPIWNTQIHVLDAALRPVPIGVWGELYIAGAGLARGYFNRPGLTAERFIASPFSSGGQRMYRSGDLARWTDAGVLEFGGRADEQVKIRGFRIEPGEIASALSAIDGIAQAAVVVREVAGERRLIAYLVPDAAGSTPEALLLRQRLGESLPDYMIPAAFITLEAYPLTSSGKLDRRALPDPEITGDSAYVPPETASEVLLCRFFAELTGAIKVSVGDNFFALGGHSLLAMSLVSRLREARGISLPLRTVFEAPTPRALAARLDDDLEVVPYNPLVVLRATGSVAPLFCVHTGLGTGLEYQPLLPHLDVQVPIYALQARGVEEAGAYHASLEEMASCYLEAVCIIQPHGPYRLLGWSFGGGVAQEMARQLEAQGESVALLVALDTWFIPDVGSDAQLAQGLDIPSSARVADRDESHYIELERVLRQRRTDAPSHDRSLLQRLLAFREHAVRIMSLHAFSQVNAPLLYFRAAGNDRALSDEFARVTRGAVEVIDIDASHSDMLNPEPAAIIAGHLNRVLSQLLLPPPASQ